MKMKPAITITTIILVSVLAAGLASAQSPRIIQNTRDTMNAVSNNATAAENEALRQTAPAPSSAAHAGMATAPKSSASVPAGAKRKHSPKRAGAVLVSVPAPTAVAPQGNAPATAAVAGNSASGSPEGQSEANEQQ